MFLSLIVARSKCPTYIGVSGIVAQETENVFKIITPNNALRGTFNLSTSSAHYLPH